MKKMFRLLPHGLFLTGVLVAAEPVVNSLGMKLIPVAPGEFAMGSALFTTGRQVGAALGIATVTALQARSPGVDGFHHSYWFVAATMTAAALVMATTYRVPSADDLLASSV